MATDYYQMPTEGPPPEQQRETVTKPAALLPKSLFKQTPNPGDTLTMTVSRVFDDEVEVSLGKSKESDQEEENDLETDLSEYASKGM